MTGALAERVESIRRFNRFYTRQIGLLQEGLLQSPFSLAEARVIYELARGGRDRPDAGSTDAEMTAGRLSKKLGLDPGYVSRILRRLRKRALIERRPSSTDGRSHALSLTAAGREAFAALDEASRSEIEALLASLDPDGQVELERSMHRIERILGAAPEPRVPWILRPHQPGDMGWVVHRHGVLYNREYGWDERFEALVAGIVSRFIEELDPRRERCWIAEREREPVGSVFLVRHPEREGVARLRLLLVEPDARGLGIGRRLVEECSRFARQVGYRRITLWTNSVLDAARHLYEREGYVLVGEEAHDSFGHELVGQTWELEL